MGNEDGLLQALTNYGTNEVIEFDGGYFSFAFGNEIALISDNKDGYFILGCDLKLFEECKRKVEEGATKEKLIEFWLKKSKKYEVSDWSADFEVLKDD